MLKRYVVLLVIGFGLTFCEDTIFDLAKAGDLTAVKEKIKSDGFDPKEKRGWGDRTVLHYAAESGSIEMVTYLAEKGADPNATSQYGTTVLHEAAKSGNLKLVQYLVKKWGADPTATDEDDWTVLHSAAMSGSLDVVQYLVEKGADPKATSGGGKTVLHYAAEYGTLEMVDYLNKIIATK